MFDILKCDNQEYEEIVKTVILKSLLQIDRSKNASNRSLTALCSFYLGIEARSNSNKATHFVNQARRVLSLG